MFAKTPQRKEKKRSQNGNCFPCRARALTLGSNTGNSITGNTTKPISYKYGYTTAENDMNNTPLMYTLPRHT